MESRVFYGYQRVESVAFTKKEDMNDDDIELMARSWPRLRNFSMFQLDHIPPKITIRALHALAIHCPDIHSIHIAVDLSASLPRLHCRTDSRLFVLDLFSPVSGDSNDLAEFLRQTFPALRKLRIVLQSVFVEEEGLDNHVINKAWIHNVMSLLPNLQS